MRKPIAARNSLWTEHEHQKAVVEWAERMSGLAPELHLLFAIPNGGKRHMFTARKMKAEGVKSGVPDLCLPIPRAGHHGLFIEMKTPQGGLTPEQREWITALRTHGYRAEVARGFEAAINIIEDYLHAR